MLLKLFAAVVAVAGIGFSGVSLVQGPASRGCCLPGAPCSEPPLACCPSAADASCCAAGAVCCDPPQACCETAAASVPVTAKKAACCDAAAPCCAGK